MNRTANTCMAIINLCTFTILANINSGPFGNQAIYFACLFLAAVCVALIVWMAADYYMESSDEH